MIKYFLVGWFSAFLFWAFSISWLFDAVNYYGAGNLLSGFITILLVSYISIYFGIFTMAVKYFQNSRFRFLILPSVFFLLEWLRSWVISGFPWLNLGAINEYLWGALPLVGAAGTSFIIVLVIALFFEKNNKAFARTFAIGLCLLMAFGPGFTQKAGQEQLQISVIQPIDTDLNEIINMTKEANSDLVVWPEAVALYDKTIIDRIGEKNVIGGFFRQEGQDIYTSAINLETQHFHDKRNLVPFGEFQPFGDLLSSVNEFFNIPNSNLDRGASTQKKADWSALICWELVFNNTFTKRVRGTDYIIHMSNDMWYGDGMSEQHLKHARMRAVESNKWVVRATIDGISQIISPRTEESSKKLDKKTKGSITHTITLNRKDTFYLKYGDMPLLILSIVFLAIGLLNRRYEK